MTLQLLHILGQLQASWLESGHSMKLVKDSETAIWMDIKPTLLHTIKTVEGITSVPTSISSLYRPLQCSVEAVSSGGAEDLLQLKTLISVRAPSIMCYSSLHSWCVCVHQYTHWYISILFSTTGNIHVGS